MTDQQQAFQKDTFVISRTDDGFRVYAVADPTKSYIVGGGPESPNCTCPEFTYHEGDLTFQCKHIRAVLEQLGVDGSEAESYEADERAAIQNEGSPGGPRQPHATNGASQMLLKRSVSPDGRIDSLSIEFSCPLNGEPTAAVRQRAFRTLRLQDEIVAGFLEVNGKANGRPPANKPNGQNGAVPARMLGIGAINTKWGRRLYVAFDVNGEKLKLFGTRKRLADALVEAGFARAAERIDEGVELNLPCRVVTRPSEDGKYTNVEHVLPANSQGSGWGRHS